MPSFLVGGYLTIPVFGNTTVNWISHVYNAGNQIKLSTTIKTCLKPIPSYNGCNKRDWHRLVRTRWFELNLKSKTMLVALSIKKGHNWCRAVVICSLYKEIVDGILISLNRSLLDEKFCSQIAIPCSLPYRIYPAEIWTKLSFFFMSFTIV